MRLIKAGILTVMFLASSAQALPLLYNWSSGSLAASANFAVVGGNLQVSLTNTSGFDVLAPNQVLTAVFFDISSNPILSPVSALLGFSSTVFFGPSNGGNLGGEWAYKFDPSITTVYGKSPQGISSAGFGIFGPPNLFPGPNLQGPVTPDGLQYGITSLGDNLATGNAAVTGSNALIRNQMVFTLSGVSSSFDPSTRISGIEFVYGTDIPAVPEPATLLLFGSGLLGAAGLARFRKKKQ